MKTSAVTIAVGAAISLAVVSGYALAQPTTYETRTTNSTITPMPAGSTALPSGEPPSRPTSAGATATALSDHLAVTAIDSGISWASTAVPYLGPGTQTYTGQAQCTANFVFTDEAHNVYVGQAAHCADASGNRQADGCTTASLPLGTPVTFNRGGRPLSSGAVIGRGELAYSSWLSMQDHGEDDPNICGYNDFALIKVDATDIGRVNPSVPHWGGPVGINTSGAGQGESVHSYGRSSLRFGSSLLAPQTEALCAADPAVGDWSHTLTSPTPGIPGDSGSAYLDSSGNALGTLSTIGFGLPIQNTIGDISHELSYAQTYSGITGLRLVLGTEPFTTG